MKNIKGAMVLFSILFSGLVLADGSIVANSSVEINDISNKELQKIFLGKQTVWPDGDNISPCYLETSDSERLFLDSVINKTSSQFHSYWTRKLFAGNGVPPKTFENEGEVMSFVSTVKGAICFVTSNQPTLPANAKLIATK